MPERRLVPRGRRTVGNKHLYRMFVLEQEGFLISTFFFNSGEQSVKKPKKGYLFFCLLVEFFNIIKLLVYLISYLDEDNQLLNLVLVKGTAIRSFFSSLYLFLIIFFEQEGKKFLVVVKIHQALNITKKSFSLTYMM